MSKLSERRREIHGMDLVTAEQELKTLRRQLFDLRIQKERGEVKDTRQFAKTRADVARLLHHISELHHAEVIEAEGGLEEEPAPAAIATTAVATAPVGRARRATEVGVTNASGASGASPDAEPLAGPESPESPATTTGSEDQEL